MDGIESAAFERSAANRPARHGRFNRRAFDYYRRLAKVKQHLEANITETLRLTEAAEIAGLNPKYFSGFFREKVGLRYTQWVHVVRVERAMRLLEAGDFSITYVAFSVGYRDLRTFQRAFKWHTSSTPWAYKRLVRPNAGRPTR